MMRARERSVFWVGAAVGAALGLPLVSLAVTALTGLGNPPELTRALRLACIFAGVPALLMGGGVARLTASRLVEHRVAKAPGRLPRALGIGASAMGVAGAGLAVLVGTPLGGMPDHAAGWIALLAAGMAAGAITGLPIGALVAARFARAGERSSP